MQNTTPPISQFIWDIKYRYKHGQEVVDKTIEDTWLRVAKAIANVEIPQERPKWEQAFYDILSDFRFLPGGRILAGAGTTHQVTLLNCFVMNIASDSLPGIFTAVQEGALTLQQGGGVGYDFSILRPQGDVVSKIDAPAAGPVAFMRIWDAMCSALLSTGARRGAMMGVLRCDHPDIEKFVTAKRDAHELRHFNVSVMVSDEFMQAVKADAEWPLVFPAKDINPHDDIIYRSWCNSLTALPCKVYKRIKAKKLWDQIIQSAYDYAEPGVLFGDTINRMNNLWYCEKINATNPCGEIPLPPYGACDLGAINLTRFVLSPFTSQAKVDWDGIQKTVKIATRFLDNVIDVSQYPLPQQLQQAKGTRRIGLGITGLANVFVMLGIPYGSPESIKLAGDIMKHIAYATWYTSIELAKSKGKFEFYTSDYLHSDFVANLDKELQDELTKYGSRNSHHNTIAPTGTISLLAGNVSNGIEPIFRAQYRRHVRTEENKKDTYLVKDYAYELWGGMAKKETLPPAWVDTNSLSPQVHLQIQAAVQPFIDNAISKTINIPEQFPLEKLTDIYTHAYELGLKGCTIFRPNPITGSVLEVPEEHCCQFENDPSSR